MANLLNTWVGYTDRSYQQIKNQFLQKLSTKAPELTDYSESNPLIILVDFFSGIGEMLNLYIDNMMRESFLASARQFTSIVKIVRLLDYRIKARYPESVDLKILFKNSQGEYISLDAELVIPQYQAFSAGGLTYYNQKSLTIPSGVNQYSISVKQVSLVSSQLLGNSDGTASQTFSLGIDYVHDSLSLVVDNQIWELVNTFGFSTPTSKHFIVDVDESGLAKLQFGDGTFGKIPNIASPIVASYERTRGPAGKVIANQTWTTDIVLTDLLTNEDEDGLENEDGTTLLGIIADLEFSNAFPSSGGSYYEDIAKIRQRAPLSIRTLDRAVTYQDYIDITSMYPGVAKAAVKHCCGKLFDVYVVPAGGGFASSTLVDNVQGYLDDRKMITTKPVVKPAGESQLKMKVTVMPYFRRIPSEVRADVLEALLEYGSAENQEINNSIKISDVTALIDNLEKVDYVDINTLYIIPYARPLDLGLSDLQWTPVILAGSTTNVNWRLTFDGADFKLYQSDVFQATVPIGVLYTDPSNIFRFIIADGVYNLANSWTFTTYPFLKNITVQDYTIPVINEANLEIMVLNRNTLIDAPNKTC